MVSLKVFSSRVWSGVGSRVCSKGSLNGFARKIASKGWLNRVFQRFAHMVSRRGGVKCLFKGLFRGGIQGLLKGWFKWFAPKVGSRRLLKVVV